jgi:hypothetical protein
MYAREYKGKTVFSLLFYIVLVVLPGCTNLSGVSSRPQESEPILATAVPTIYMPTTQPIKEPDPFPFSLDEVEVFCQFDIDTTKNYDHWADTLIPGVSTIDNLFALTSIPDKTQPERIGAWRYNSDAVHLQFYNGVLEQKADPRITLGEIVQHYGHPQMIVWEIPRQHFDEASYVTYLVYPEHKAVFFEWNKVTQLAFNTEFRYSNFSTQEIFDTILARFVDDDYYRYEELVWPCEE